jgi:hypothetical protein
MIWINTFLLESLLAVYVDVSMPSPSKPRYDFNSLLGARLAKSPMSGGSYTCFLSNLTAQGKNFLMMIDTGSTDTILPSNVVNNYGGPTIDLAIPPDAVAKSSSYGDGSWWRGFILRTTVGLFGTSISGNVPIAMMVNQSTSPIFASGEPANGLMGLAFESLSSAPSPPFSVVDAWLEQRAISKNQIAFHGCPYTREAQSWIDIGNETPYTGCGNQSVTINMPYKSYYNLDVQGISVGGIPLPLPTTFQPMGNSRRRYSILDSCTSMILLPSSITLGFQDMLKNSTAFSRTLRTNFYFEQWINGDILMSNLQNHIDFSMLPNITFEIATGRKDYNSTKLVLGPRQYIQVDNDGFCIPF